MTTRTVKVAVNPDLVTGDELAADIGVNPKTLQRWAREGRGPRRVRLGNRAYYFRPEVEAWLKDQFGR
jgi:predicted DNA-binding transcriptional regulator AlpA